MSSKLGEELLPSSLFKTVPQRPQAETKEQQCCNVMGPFARDLQVGV